MDFTLTIQSLNKIAVGAFVFVLILIIFETYMMLKNDKKKKVITSLPDFNGGMKQKTVVAPPPVQQVKIPEVRKGSTSKKVYVGLLLVVLLGLMGATGYYFYSQSVPSTQKVAQTPSGTSDTAESQVKTVESSGIILFDATWERIYSENIESELGDKIYIGIETVAGSDIDKARIRVNKEVWGAEDEVTAINNEKGVYYKEYVVATSEPTLKIDAQLHSRSGGWLSE